MNREALGRKLIGAILDHLRVGSVTITEDGVARSFGSGEPHALAEIHSPRVWGELLHGSRGLALSYANGL